VSAGWTFRVALASLGLATGAYAPAPWGASSATELRPARVPAERAAVIVVRVGGDLSARAGQYVEVPVTVDMTGAPGRSLGAYRLSLVYDPSVLYFNNVKTPSGFAEPLVNADSSYSYGVLKFTALRPSGATGVITLFTVRFYVSQDVAPSAITLDLQELTEAGTFADLLPLAQVVNGTFCRSYGTWGDVDNDGASNSRDALLALSRVVGLVGDTIIDTLATVPVLVTDTMIVSLADVDGDGAVTSRDALIILSGAVGLPVTGFRIGLPAAGACATGSASTLVILPDSLELQSGQQSVDFNRVKVLVQARDGTGRVVPATGLTWRSSNSSVAAWVDDYYDPGIEARDPGVATLTAELGPGVRATLKVVVLARRRNWYVDVARALNVPTQAGSQALPFAFIGDAMNQATDGDTVHVASGEYDERVSVYTSVTLLGDSLNRPVVDQRGSPGYDPNYNYYATISAGSAAAKMEIAHLILRGGGIYIEAHDNTVRDVRIEARGSSRPALEIYSYASVSGAPRGGPAAAPGQRDLGQALVENVVIDGYSGYGIEIDQADTAIIRNNQILRDSAGTYAYCEGSPAIAVYDVNSSEVRNNVITNAQCDGIDVQHDAGRSVIARNRVTGAAGTGIRVSVPVIALDHNTVRDIGTGTLYSGNVRGIEVTTRYTVDALTSLGDSVIGSDHAGFSATAIVGTIDSLVVDTTGRDSSYGSYGLELQDGRYTVRHSHISNTLQGDGINGCAYVRTTITSIGNRISNPRYNGINVGDCSEGSQADTLISVHDTVAVANIGIYAGYFSYVRVDSADLSGRLIQYNGGVHVNGGRLVVRDSRIRGFESGVAAYNGESTVEVRRNTFIANGNGMYFDSPSDSVVIVGNTIDSNATTGVEMWYGASARVDSNVIRVSGVSGILLQNLSGQAVIRGNTVDSTVAEAVYLYSGSSAFLTRNTITRSGLSGVALAYVGYNTGDTTLVTGNTVTGSGADGIAAVASPIRADSNRVTNSAMSGLAFYSGGGGRVTRNRFQNNSWYGVAIDASFFATFPSVANNAIQGNVRAGAANFSFPYATMDADSNYWGDAAGPRCDSVVTGVGCGAFGRLTGDSVVSAGITFTPFLASSPTGVPAAPRVLTGAVATGAPVGPVTRSAPTSAFAAEARRAALTQRDQARAQAARQQAALRPPQPVGAQRVAPSGPRAFPNAWQRGREPRPPRPFRDSTAH
jgi:hypothetical protein